MIKQTTKIAVMIILAIGFTTNAAAQSKTKFDLVQYIPLTGVETAKGTFEPLTNMIYGNSFALNNFEGSETKISAIFAIAVVCILSAKIKTAALTEI